MVIAVTVGRVVGAGVLVGLAAGWQRVASGFGAVSWTQHIETFSAGLVTESAQLARSSLDGPATLWLSVGVAAVAVFLALRRQSGPEALS